MDQKQTFTVENALLFAAEAAGDIPIKLSAIATRTGKQNPLHFAWIDAVRRLSDPSALAELVVMDCIFICSIA